jgi:hypothetical protein
VHAIARLAALWAGRDSPHLFEDSLDLLGLVPRYALNDVLWRALDEILRFLQPETREGSDSLMTSIFISLVV